MELSPWKLNLISGWDKNFVKFDWQVQQQILKKLNQMKQPLASRGLHSSQLHVEEVGQYRIVFRPDDGTKIKNVYFVGDHKQYEKWLREVMEM
ncbi:hypothetical protein HY546_02115 [archaeon]|nr:hypothetical protein [archaeon]